MSNLLKGMLVRVYKRIHVGAGDCVYLSTRIFTEMDTSGDQKLDFEEFRQTLLQLDKKLKSLPATAQVASQQVNILLLCVCTMYNVPIYTCTYTVPCTAIVTVTASHVQGAYLGNLLSNTNGEVVSQTTQELETTKLKPFKYRHLGSFAYVGDNRAVLQLPIIGTFICTMSCLCM